MKKKKILTTWLRLISCAFLLPIMGTQLQAQILYGLAGGGAVGYIVQINIATCEVCPVGGMINDQFNADLAALPNGNVITVGGNRIRVYTPPSSVPVATLVLPPGQFAFGVAVSPSGTVYISGIGLGTYNPLTNTYTYIGPFPAAIAGGVADLFYNGNQLMGSNNSCLVLVNVTDPLQSTLTGVCLTPPVSMSGITYLPGSGYIGANADILFSIDSVSGTYNILCDLTGFPFNVGPLEYFPASIPMPGCLCLTDAGTVSNSTLNRCTNQSATVPYNNNAVLEGNDILRYILFSNPADTLGSIVAENGTGVFNFDPATMQTGIPYYLATVAGNNLNGGVDPNDPCLDISNAAILIWRPTPAVTFSIGNPTICEGDCRTLTVNLTGTPPFSLTYDTPYATGLTQVFSANTGTLTLCVPLGASLGQGTVQATSLTDGWCTCG